MDDPVDGAILLGVGDVFTLGFPVIVGEEVFVGDGIYIDMSWGFDRRLDEMGFVMSGIGREQEEKFLELVKGFFDGDGLVSPVDRGVDIFQPGKS